MSSGIQKLSLDTTIENKNDLVADFKQAKADLDAALRNSFDTPAALQVVLRLVRNANVAMSESAIDLSTVEAVARWVTKIVGIFGLDPNAQPPYTSSLGWGPANPAAAAGSAGGVVPPKVAVQPYSSVFAKVKGDVAALGLTTEVTLNKLLAELRPDAEFGLLENELEENKNVDYDVEHLALPFLRAVSSLRDELRRAATDPDNKDTKAALLALSDRIRDYDLVELGVQLDDQPDRPSLVKFVPVAKLVAAREEKAAAAAEKARLKEEAQRAREAAEKEKWAKAKLPPQDLYRHNTADFSAWDADGLPTKLADGSDVPKTQTKRLKKEWDRQKKLHESYLEKFGPA